MLKIRNSAKLYSRKMFYDNIVVFVFLCVFAVIAVAEDKPGRREFRDDAAIQRNAAERVKTDDKKNRRDQITAEMPNLGALNDYIDAQIDAADSLPGLKQAVKRVLKKQARLIHQLANGQD